MLWDLRTAVSYFLHFHYLAMYYMPNNMQPFVSLDTVLTNAFCVAVASGYHGYAQGKGMMLFFVVSISFQANILKSPLMLWPGCILGIMC